MAAATLWIEIIIAGFPFVVALFAMTLTLLGITDLRALPLNDKYLPYLSAVAVAASYVVGILALRLVQVSFPVVTRILPPRWRAPADASTQSTGDGNIPFHAEMAMVWQLGSERLNREIDFQYSLLALFASLLASLPFLGASVSAWLRSAGMPKFWLPMLGAVVLLVPVLAAFARQRSVVRSIRSAAIAHLSSYREHLSEHAVEQAIQVRK